MKIQDIIPSGTKYEVHYTATFKHGFKKAMKRKLPIFLLEDTITRLANGETLPPEYEDHKLTGDWAGYREFHLLGDWLCVYTIDNGQLILTLTELGSHSDIFGS